MQFVIRAFLVLAAAALLLPEPGTASVIFKPGQKAKYVAPGEEELIQSNVSRAEMSRNR